MMGRPIEFTPERIQEIIEKMERYIEENDIPIVAEFAYQNDIRRAALYEYPDFSYTLQKLINKKEAQLEKLGLFNVVNASMAKFSLAQMGWSEKQETKVDGGVQIVYGDKDDAKL